MKRTTSGKLEISQANPLPGSDRLTTSHISILLRWATWLKPLFGKVLVGKLAHQKLIATSPRLPAVCLVARNNFRGSFIRRGGCDSADFGSGGRNEVGRIADPFSSSLGASSVRDRPLRELRRPVHSGRGPDKSPRIGKTTQIVFLNDPSTRPESSQLRRVDPQGLVRERARQARSRPVPPKARCPFGSARVLLGISSFVRNTCRFPNTAPGISGRAQELFGVV